MALVEDFESKSLLARGDLPLSTGNTLIVCEKAKSAWLRDSFIGESPSLIHKWLGGKVKVQALE